MSVHFGMCDLFRTEVLCAFTVGNCVSVCLKMRDEAKLETQVCTEDEVFQIGLQNKIRTPLNFIITEAI